MLAQNAKKINVKEFLEVDCDDQAMYELIDGIIMMSPRPTESHMIIATNLATSINMYMRAKGKDCSAILENQLLIDDYNYYIPDLMVKCFDEKRNDEKKPFLVMEVLSPSTMHIDLLKKMNKYRAMGIPEYWVINPKTREVTVYDFENEDVQKYYFDDSGIAKSHIFDDMNIDLREVFKFA